jgi:hypothetical protein
MHFFLWKKKKQQTLEKTSRVSRLKPVKKKVEYTLELNRLHFGSIVDMMQFNGSQ